MANVKITELPSADALTGTEETEVVQGGVSKRTTLSAHPISTATASALEGKSATGHNHSGVYDPAGTAAAAITAARGAADGLAPLGSDSKVPAAYLPSYVDDVLEYANYGALPGTGETGKIYIALDTGAQYRWSGSAYVQLVGSPGSTDAVPEGSVNLYHTTGRAAAAAPVQSVAGLAGTILAAALKSALALVKGDVGLGNVNNTSDVNKPVSTATQTALDAKRSITTSRERLTGNRNYYVRTDGSDSNDGSANTSGGAFLTIQKAIDTAAALDLSIYNVTIDVADGTYTGGLTLKSYVGGGYILIRGNTTTPANVLLNVTGNCVYGEDCGNWQLSGVKLVSTSRGIYLVGRSALKISLIDFGACTYNHMLIESGARVRATGNWTISGGSGSAHIGLNYGGSFVAAVLTCTITGTPALTYFVDASIGSNATLQAMTFSGSATGTRYSATMNSVIQTYGGGSTYLPGNVAGSTATGGQYA